MTKQLTLICALASVQGVSAVNLATLDFEADEFGFFSFAQNGANITTIQTITGAGGTDGIATRVTADPGTFAGGGIGGSGGPFDTAVAGFIGGAVTTADFDTITGSFDVNMPVGQQIAIRIEPGNAGFPERADLGVTIDGTGAFQTVTFDTLSVDPGQRTTFLNALNGGNETNLKFIFQINNQGGAVGSDFIFDNLALNAGAVPEPTSGVLALTGSLMLLRRRRK